MEDISRRLARSGAQSLVLGILTMVFGLTVGVLSVINGASLLASRKKAP